MKRLWLVAIYSVVFLNEAAFVLSQRNAEAEAFCQPFLTSPSTSPLVPSLNRNLKIDEDGEFNCELVLQDRDLPPQIRVTVHEGLSYLAIRHVQMGLMRHQDVIRHLKILADILPSSFRFNSRAGSWSLDSNIFQPQDAVKYLSNALYGKASTDTETSDEDILAARRDFARALSFVGDLGGAQREFLQVLRISPNDFGIAFLLKDVTSKLMTLNSCNETVCAEEADVQNALSPSERLYKQVTKLAEVGYTGFRPSARSLAEFPSMPTPEEFDDIVQRREPIVIRGSRVDGGVDTLLNWRTSKWEDSSYLVSAAGEEEVYVERRGTKGDMSGGLFGFGAGIHRVKQPFKQFLANHFSTSAGMHNSEVEEYLNVQENRDANGSIWRPPLHTEALRADIPMPSILQTYVDDGSMSDVNLWMGNAESAPGKRTVSRLHMDATDNLYVLLCGRKTFKLLSPHYAPLLKTIAPTYAVTSNGLSFQFNPANNNTSVDAASARNYHFSMATDSELEESEISRTVVSVHMEAGDMLFVPTGWFHQVTSYGGRHVAVNFWWRPPGWRNATTLEREARDRLMERLKNDMEPVVSLQGEL